MARLYIGLVCLFLVACSSKKSGGDGGSDGAAADAEVTVTESTLVAITSSNVASYSLSGTCTIEGQPVTIELTNSTPTPQPTCSDKKWSATFDLTGHVSGPKVTIVIKHSKADDSSTDQVSKSVDNSFVCGTGYIGVPPLDGYTDKAFCVMKYEASEGAGSIPVSTASTPWVSINHTDAKAKCAAVGTGYDLISNDEWQTIARNIEKVASNWKEGTVGNAGGLNVGHTDGTPASPQAASGDDTKACENTGQTCSDTVWDSQRRTHKLSNGNVIWDMAGNVREFVKDAYESGTSLGAAAQMSQVTDTSHATAFTLVAGSVSRARKVKAHFGPSGDYTSLSSAPHGGLGEYGADVFSHISTTVALDRVFTRGTEFGSGQGGIFSANGGLSLTNTATTIGFRCVQNPT